MADTQAIDLEVEGAGRVSALLLAPASARACYVLAHGAGAGMTHPFMAAVAAELAARDIATLRYQFPYMEQKPLRARVTLPAWRAPRLRASASAPAACKGAR
jgi:predicted alpha/beta-hydrolase family hydrolase